MENTKKNTKSKAILFQMSPNYINPADCLKTRLLQDIFDLTIYGPDYKSGELINDLYEVSQRLGPFEAAFIQDSFYTNPQVGDISEHYNNPALESFGKNFDKIEAHKFLILRGDPYACTEIEKEAIIKFPGTIIAIPEYLMVPESKREEAHLREGFAQESSSRYIEALEARTQDIIPMTFFIHEDEFMNVKGQKRYDISIPGVLYYERKLVLERLRKNKKYRIVVSNAILTILDYIEAYSRQSLNRVRWAIYLRNVFFRKMINQSSCTYTDGSSFAYPVRKFFEIPAYGSLLMAAPFYNYEKLGFKENENFISANSENIIVKLDYVFKNPNQAKRILENSRELIRRTHSFQAWKGYFSKIWSRIQANDFNGAYWEKGELRLR